MRIEDNEAGGITVVLAAGDELDEIPESHYRLLIPKIAAVYSDPVAYFHEVARRCPFSQMKTWLTSLVARGEWELHLNLGPYPDDYPEHYLCGFDWRSESVRPALIELPRDYELSTFPDEMQAYWSLVGEVSWSGFGVAGGLAGCTCGQGEDSTYNPPLSAFFSEWRGADIDPDEAVAWGHSPCGDMVIYLNDGRAGWAEHGAHQIRLLGSIGDTIDHIFGKLMRRECPEWEQQWYLSH